MTLSYQTPLLKSLPYSNQYSKNVYLKLENTQPSGSFKSRGLGSTVQHYHDQANGQGLHFFSSSGGNAGLATAVAATTKGHKCTVVVPESTKPLMRDLITATGADLVVHGAFWGDADKHLREVLLPAANAQKGTTAVYCHPFDNPLLWTGYAAIVREIKAQLSLTADGRGEPQRPDAIVCAVGGGGLYTGLMQGLHADPELAGVPVLTAETEGASKLAQSLAEGHKVTLAVPHTIATSLAAYAVSDAAYTYASTSTTNRTYALSVTDEEAVSACVDLATQNRIIVEPACGAALAVLGKLVPGAVASSGEKLPESVTRKGAVIVVIVCGGSGFTLDSIIEAKKSMKID